MVLFDGASTALLVARFGTGIELNPAMAAVTEAAGPWTFVCLKAALAALLACGGLRLAGLAWVRLAVCMLFVGHLGLTAYHIIGWLSL